MERLVGSFAEEVARVKEHRVAPIPQVQRKKRMQKHFAHAPANLMLLQERTTGPAASHGET
jgi:hypothetical protein